jgi:hypothetical protein
MSGKGDSGTLDEGLASAADERVGRATPASGPASPGTSSTVARGRESSSAAVDLARLSSDEAPLGRKAERARRSRAPGQPAEPSQMLDLGELPETYGKDEVGILTKDPFWYFVYWEVTATGEAAAREQLGPSGESARLVLRLFITLPAPAGANPGRESRELRDVVLPQHHGRKYLEAPRPGASVRAAVGLLSGEGYFAPIAHSALVRMPPQQPAAQTSIEWLHVLPVRNEGHKRERIVSAAPSAPPEERPVTLAAAEAPSENASTLPDFLDLDEEAAALFPPGPLEDVGSAAAPGPGRPGRRGGRTPRSGPGLGNGSGGLS